MTYWRVLALGAHSVTALDSAESPAHAAAARPLDRSGQMATHRGHVRPQEARPGITRASVWEVVGTTCGDRGGLYQEQPLEIKVLRGLHVSEFEAREALRKHLA
jgi:hypothetical protein